MFTIETLRTLKPDFILVEEIDSFGDIKLLKRIDVSEIRNDWDYITIYHDDPLKQFLSRPLYKFSAYSDNQKIYHVYTLEQK